MGQALWFTRTAIRSTPFLHSLKIPKNAIMIALSLFAVMDMLILIIMYQIFAQNWPDQRIPKNATLAHQNKIHQDAIEIARLQSVAMDIKMVPPGNNVTMVSVIVTLQIPIVERIVSNRPAVMV